MSDDTGYKIVPPQIHKAKYDEQDGTVKEGYEIKVFDPQTQTRFTIFLPEDRYTADNVDRLIKYHLQRIRDVANLGQ